MEDRSDIEGPHYNMSGKELARRLVIRAFRTNAAHQWVQDNAHDYMVGNRSGADPNRPRPSDFQYEPGNGLVRLRDGVRTLVSEGRLLREHAAADPSFPSTLLA